MSYPTPTSFDHLVNLIRSELGDTKGLTCLSPDELIRLQNIIRSYTSILTEWQQYAYFDTGRYTRNLVDDGNGKYNLLILAWGPNQQSPIHDHANSHCIMKCLAGDLWETRYDWPKSHSNKGEEVDVKPMIPTLEIIFHQMKSPISTIKSACIEYQTGQLLPAQYLYICTLLRTTHAIHFVSKHPKNGRQEDVPSLLNVESSAQCLNCVMEIRRLANLFLLIP